MENDAYPETRDALDIRWALLFQELRVLPILLPTWYDTETFFREIDIDGVVLTGGNDLAVCSASPLSTVRDAFEKRLLACSVARQIPVVGICRGMQLIGHYFGSRLVPAKGHGGIRHNVAVQKGSRYASLLEEIGEVNSYHNYSVADLPECLAVSATAGDGTIEAIEHRELQVFGQMWHCERETPPVPKQLALLRSALRLEDF